MWPFNFAQKNGASLADEGLLFEQPGTAYIRSEAPLPETPGPFTLRIRFRPSAVDGGETGLILGFARDFLRQNMIFAQVGPTIGFKFAVDDGSAHHIWANCLVSTDPVDVTLTHDGSTTRLFCNGELKNEQRLQKDRSIRWDPACPFVFGSDGSGSMTWRGTIIALTISPGTSPLDSRAENGSGSSPWMSLHFPEDPQRRTDGLFVPYTFQPATKTTIFDTLFYWKTNRYYVTDILLNILLFVPFGMGLAFSLRDRGFSARNAVLLSAGVSLVLTGGIEFAQFYLPTRFPSLSDIISNSFGGLTGALVAVWGVRSGAGASGPGAAHRPKEAFHRNILAIDAAVEVEAIAERIRSMMASDLRKRGAVVAVSGGIDSAVCAALCVRALGPERVFALLLPERVSSPESTRLGSELTRVLGVRSETHDISAILEAAGCYRSQDDAIRSIVPEYGPQWKHKVVLPSLLDSERLNVTRLVVETPDGRQTTHRLSASAYLQLIAATNFKQRTRKMLEYYHADRLNYAVCGTPNRLEYDQGFFVKLGDGSADFKPIAHLYKTQVFALGKYLGVPEGILVRPPTTDTFSIPQSQEEFYYALPYELMDLCLYAFNHGYTAQETGDALHLSPDQVERVFDDFRRKRTTTRPLHLPPQLARSVREVEDLIRRPEQP